MCSSVRHLLGHILPRMKRIGSTDRTWSTQKAIQQQVEKEAWLEWAEKPIPELTYVNRKNDFKLSFAAKHAFTRGISLFKL